MIRYNSALQYSRFFLQSLMARTLMLVAGSVLLAQLVVWGIWQIQWRADASMALSEVADNMAVRVSSTIEYFNSLPTEYRHIVLDQLRDMRGGSYLVTLNREFITVDPLPVDAQKHLVIDRFSRALDANTSIQGDVAISFADPRTLHVFNNRTLLVDLPGFWDSHTQLLQPYNPPVLVLQVPITNDEWLYVATVIPNALMVSVFQDQMLNMFGMILLALLLILTALKVREITQPFANLARAAANFGRDLTPVPLPERGSREVLATIHAFNQMQDNIRQYMNDRKALFSGISHDLKTPLTRLRLRAAMMDDDREREAFEQDLDYLDLMVKGALQTLRETDIHENADRVNLLELIEAISTTYRNIDQPIEIDASKLKETPVIVGKPLALRRCLENLIDNAVRYGSQADIAIQSDTQKTQITITDHGPGVPTEKLKNLFQPYLRLAHGKTKNPDGNGLGLMIARHLIRSHGGELELNNAETGGLEARITFPAYSGDSE